MNLLDLHARLAAKSAAERAELLPGEYLLDLPGGRAECWPAVATAAVILAGSIATLEGDDDLREALQHFQSLLSIGVVDEAGLERQTLEVVGELCRWGWEASGEAGLAAAPWN